VNEVSERKVTIYDFIVIGLLIFVVLSIEMMAKRWGTPFVPNAHISLNPVNLVKYTLYSATRGFIAYFISLIFILVVAKVFLKGLLPKEKTVIVLKTILNFCMYAEILDYDSRENEISLNPDIEIKV